MLVIFTINIKYLQKLSDKHKRVGMPFLCISDKSTLDSNFAQNIGTEIYQTILQEI